MPVESSNISPKGNMIQFDILRLDLIQLQIGSCTCLTKSPDLEYHAKTCMYRRIQTILDDIGVLYE